MSAFILGVIVGFFGCMMLTFLAWIIGEKL